MHSLTFDHNESKKLLTLINFYLLDMSVQQVKSLDDFVNPDNKFLGEANHFCRPIKLMKRPAENDSKGDGAKQRKVAKSFLGISSVSASGSSLSAPSTSASSSALAMANAAAGFGCASSSARHHFLVKATTVSAF